MSKKTIEKIVLRVFWVIGFIVAYPRNGESFPIGFILGASLISATSELIGQAKGTK